MSDAIITQPEDSFYSPTEGRRLSIPIGGWLYTCTEMVCPPEDGHPSKY